MDSNFYLFRKLLSAFFFFSVSRSNKTRSNCVVLGCNLSRKDKLTLYKTQNGEPNYVARIFFYFCKELPVPKLGDRHPNTIVFTSSLVHVLCDFKATWHQEASVSLEYSMKIHLADIFYLLGEIFPSNFSL